VKIYSSEQGSLQWKLDRAGAITASMYSTIRKLVGGLDERQQKYVDAILAGEDQASALEVSGYKSPPKAASVQKALNGEKPGEYSDATKNYAFRLAVERIAGTALDDSDFETWAMRRGKELEEDCRLRHEADIGEIVDVVSFISTDDGKFGCSADGLISLDGGGEYKCFIAPDKLRPIIIEDDWGDIQDQGQGCMWITGRKWFDFCLYCPALAPVGMDFVRKRVYRDDDYIEALEQDLVAFDRYVEQCREQVIEAARQRGVLPEQAAAALAPVIEASDKLASNF
jgi:hypothetical protein